MAYHLTDINAQATEQPEAFIKTCDAHYWEKIVRAADMICANLEQSPIVLLSGPSGSGKTTTALKIQRELTARGIITHSISMDNYFLPKTPDRCPVTADGQPDYESPGCLDMDLLNDHFTKLTCGKPVIVPKFSFSQQSRSMNPARMLSLKDNEVAIFEGIHALNDCITSVHPEAFKLYISARSNVMDEKGQICFKGTWMRLVRRSIRDFKFRGSSAEETLGMWANVRRGEKNYISPFKDKADLQFDSSFPYEVPVLKKFASALFADVPQGVERYEELRQIMPAFGLFEEIDSELLPEDSLLREFIGGGIYQY